MNLQVNQKKEALHLKVDQTTIRLANALRTYFSSIQKSELTDSYNDIFDKMKADVVISEFKSLFDLLDILKKRALIYSPKIEANQGDHVQQSSAQLSNKIENLYNLVNSYVKGLDFKPY